MSEEFHITLNKLFRSDPTYTIENLIYDLKIGKIVLDPQNHNEFMKNVSKVVKIKMYNFVLTYYVYTADGECRLREFPNFIIYKNGDKYKKLFDFVEDNYMAFVGCDYTKIRANLLKADKLVGEYLDIFLDDIKSNFMIMHIDI